MEKRIEAWHFLPVDGCVRFDGMKVEPGFIYYEECEPALCHKGLHASIKPLDALRFAPGPIICKVVMSGKIIHGDDKLVATEREVIWMADATETLREFVRWAAAEWAAARDAARDAGWDAGWDAERATAEEKKQNDKLEQMLITLGEDHGRH